MTEDTVSDQDMYLGKNPILLNLSNRKGKKVYHWMNWSVWIYILVAIRMSSRDTTWHDLYRYLMLQFKKTILINAFKYS